MRISDWSSDVCSSDLAGDVGQRALRRRRRLHVDAGVLPLHRPRLPHDADAELLGLQALGERLVGRVDAGAGLRSEEHTSELQSLMRISYAVFCLKNKTVTPSPQA